MNATATVLCLDLSDRNSFEGVEAWVEDLQTQLEETGGVINHSIFIVGLKGELPRHSSLPPAPQGHPGTGIESGRPSALPRNSMSI